MKTRLLRYCFLMLLMLVAFGVEAQNVLPRPNPPKLVNDNADVLSPEQEAQLERKLVAYDDSTSNQVVVVTLRTLDNYPIEEYSTKLFRDWGIGNKKTNNGILIIAAIDDRQIRIETGYGLEGAIPDIVANQIIRNDIGPAFRSGDYYEGFDKATTSVIQAAAGEYKASEEYSNRGRKKPGVGSILFIIILIILVLSRMGGGGGGGFMSRRGYRGFGPVFWPGGGFGGGGGGFGGSGGGFGGGGFGGFGGGSSGGGGASGSW